MTDSKLPKEDSKEEKELIEALRLARTMLRVGMPEYDGTDVLEIIEDAIKRYDEAHQKK